MEKTVRITETVLRDANQSQIATRLRFEEFEGALKLLDAQDYESLEVWGGATFDSCLRYLDEDPWERLRKIREACPNSKLQMLLRGQNILGYKHYPDDVVRAFVRRSVENGIDIIRIFDALNDPRNLETALDECLKAGAEAQLAISYTHSPIHSIENYLKLVERYESLGASSICIKDMAGIMSPKEAYELVSGIKRQSKLPLHVHTHATTGLASMTYLKAVEAGADFIDTAISSFSGGTSQPATETIVYALQQFGYKINLDIKELKKINDFFKPVQAKYLETGGLNPSVLGTKTDALNYQIPGGMLSNLIAQLKGAGKLDALEDVFSEVPNVRKDLGYPPLVTPISQMVGAQAVSNVLLGERYKNISREVKAYVRGEYGQAPSTIDPVLQKRILGDEKPYTCRFADTLEPGLEAGKKEAGELAKNLDDVLSYIAFPKQASEFFQKRDEKEKRRCRYRIEAVED